MVGQHASGISCSARGPVVVVGQVAACAGTTGGVKEFFPFVLAVVELDVVGIEFGQVFEQAGTMAVLGVNEQIQRSGNGSPGRGSMPYGDMTISDLFSAQR